jgi:hypothetical protein
MPVFIKNINDENLVEFDTGTFDSWCVFLKRRGKPRYPPKDSEYFLRLQQLGLRHGYAKIYNDFLQFYLRTNKSIDINLLNLITQIAQEYESDSEEMDIWFSVIYAGMVAEENKEFAILKKRIKRLGMHQVLLEGMDAGAAARFSRGRRWQDLDILMKRKGF